MWIPSRTPHLLLLAHTIGPLLPTLAQTPRNIAHVPFVGCPSHDQLNFVKPPTDDNKQVTLSAKATQQLAYYKAELGFGVLAPRGWHCFGLSGSGGTSLYVVPEPIQAEEIYSKVSAGFKGPVVALEENSGAGGSGSFQVAEIIARVFPAYKDFLTGFRADGVPLPAGPYPTDKLTYKSKRIVEYETPANTDGLGTQPGIMKDSLPIAGVAVLSGKAPDAELLTVRLPTKLKLLAPAIVQQLEEDLAKQ